MNCHNNLTQIIFYDYILIYLNQRENNMGGTVVGDYKAYLLGKPKISSGYDPERHLNVLVQIVDPSFRPVWEKLFLQSYLIYRGLDEREIESIAKAIGCERSDLDLKRKQAATLVMLLKYSGEETGRFSDQLKERLSDIKNVLELNWQKFTEDKDTICVVAYPLPGQDVNPDTVVGLSYATICYDFVLGRKIAKAEGTYVPRDYRDRGVGTQILTEMSRVLRDEFGAAQMFYWSHKKNPNTGNIYPSLRLKDKDLTLNSIKTDEEMWVLGLSPASQQQYGNRKQNFARTARYHNSDGFSLARLQEKDKGIFEKFYPSFLLLHREESSPEKIDRVWREIFMNNRLRAYIIKADKDPCGIAMLQGDIKLPRDAFLTAQASVYIKDGCRSILAMRKVFDQFVKDAKLIDPRIDAMRWVMQKDDPHLGLIRKNMAIEIDEGISFPTLFDFNLYRLPLVPECAYKGRVASDRVSTAGVSL